MDASLCVMVSGITPVRESSLLKLLLWGLLTTAALAYLIQVATPLRLNTDAYRLLSLAVSAHEGRGFLVDGEPDQFPPAYPLAVRSLMDASIANAATLVILNLASLGFGLALLWRWLRKLWGGGLSPVLLVLLWTMLSWVLIKHITLPLTECLYLAFSMLTLELALRFLDARGRRKWVWIILAFSAAWLALMTRTVGVTLFPALALCLLLH
ncbi:MAG: hypothetical protein AAGI44_08700, partial [Pseudomonadota bacterium]